MEEIKPNTKNQDSKENSSIKRIGNFIRDARLSRNQTIEELASTLKIGSHQLQAIEDGDIENLPEEVFIKAMVRRISEKLKLDTEFIMKEFKSKRKDVILEEVVKEVSDKNVNTREKEIKSQSSWGFAIFVLVSGIFGLLASSLIFNYFSESFQDQSIKKELLKKN